MMERKTLEQWSEEFISYKHGLGIKYDDLEHHLHRYISFAKENGDDESPNVIEKDTVRCYLAQDLAPTEVYFSVCALRQFGKYLVRNGIPAYVIPPKTTKLPTPTPPYFFTEEEISSFFETIDRIKQTKGRYKGRELIIPAVFRLLYCCGLRCIEARRLKRENVSLTGGYVDILQSKALKDRRCYFNEELRTYLSKYDKQISALFPNRTYFFPSFENDDSPLSEGFISGNFSRYWDKTFPNFSSDKRPRAYDFRHHFAYANINKWAREGKDVMAMLPYLMRYMGHSSYKQTLYYFHFVPDYYQDYKDLANLNEDILPEV